MVRPVRSLLALLLLTTTAHAAPIATLVEDIDGDGAADRIELEGTGELHVDTKKGQTKAMLPVKPARATLSGALVRGVPTIIVSTDTEGIALQPSGSTWKQVVKTTIGGVGLDADYSIALDANADGIYRYQTRPDARRCDGKPAYLFAERFESGKFQPLSKLPVDVPANAPTIMANLERKPPATPPMTFKARVASHQPGAPDAGALAQPQELDDGNANTVWKEDLPSAGEGQFFTYVSRMPDAKASQVRIVAGNVKGGNRPKRLAVVSAQGAWHREWHIDIHDGPAGAAWVADLPEPVGGCLTIVIESTYGAPNGTLALSELEVYADKDGDPALAHEVATGGGGASAAAQELARRGAPGVAAIEAELAKTTDANTRTRLVRALVANRDPSKGPVIAHAASEGWIAGDELTAAIKALTGTGQGQALHDLAARQAVALDARVAAVRALSPAVEKERDFLVDLAGRGRRELRQAVIEQLTDVPVATLGPIAEAQSKASAAGDMWRAITRRAHAKPEERAAALAALSAALPGAADYERRYRIVDGIAAVGDAAALGTLAALFKQWPANEQTAAIKQVAARAMAVNPRADALDLIVALTSDADPGVRLAALSAIAGVTAGNAGAWHGPVGADGIDRVLQTRLDTDTWPEVRRYTAQVLGGRCARPGPAAALADSLARDPDVGVRGDALAGLVECKAPSAPALLEKTWNDANAPLELRQRAIDLAVTLADRALAQKLVAKYTKWRGDATESEKALQLVQNAAYAIGRLRAPGAAEALTAALDDTAFPEIVASAAAGLGLLGPACPATVRPRLEGLARGDEHQIATAAARAYDLCGK